MSNVIYLEEKLGAYHPVAQHIKYTQYKAKLLSEIERLKQKPKGRLSKVMDIIMGTPALSKQVRKKKWSG